MTEQKEPMELPAAYWAFHTTIGFPSMMAARTWVEDALARTGWGW